MTLERRESGDQRRLLLHGHGAPYDASLVPRGTRAADLSWQVVAPSGAAPPAGWLAGAVAWAQENEVLDLRVRRVDAGGAEAAQWQALGFTPLAAGCAELVLPVPVALPDADATRALGVRLAGAVRAGDLLVLSGPLGAGKTALTAGLAAALGVRGAVTSPTFVLARLHRGPLPLLHVDAYRLRAAGQELFLDDLDLDAALEEAVTVVEWGEGVVEGLSPSRLAVRIDRSTGAAEDGDGRTATVRAVGPRWAVLPEEAVGGGRPSGREEGCD